MSAVAIQSNGQQNKVTRPFGQRRAVEPLVDVLESADDLLVVADVPGAPADSIDVRVENDTLTLDARMFASKDTAVAREYDEVDFSRTFRIPAGIDAAQITAEAKNGTVVIRLPKSAAAKPRRIEVRPS